ncbi:MAG TPA: KilA-N domain-containing protein [Candidatus Kapabacteria bacterium]|jgi:hypothetical protein|nr:KilA-N domain-containing protein [Candidatus Kapabacteria bacterium]
MSKKQTILNVKGTDIALLSKKEEDYISLTDIAKTKNPDEPRFVIQNWMKTKYTVEFLGFWEVLNNRNFNRVEFDTFKNEAGSNAFVLTPQKWVEHTNAIGIITKAGRYGGGTFAHKDIAFEFASWISAEFKLYLIKEFQRLKEDENSRLKLEWNLSRTLAKVNYQIHTDAIKTNLIPPDLSKLKQNFIYANEADILNVALFGRTAKEWRDENPEKDGNIRDYATIEQLIVLTNLESLNSVLIKQSINANERIKLLNKTAIEQMRILVDKNASQKLLM